MPGAEELQEDRERRSAWRSGAGSVAGCAGTARSSDSVGVLMAAACSGCRSTLGHAGWVQPRQPSNPGFAACEPRQMRVRRRALAGTAARLLWRLAKNQAVGAREQLRPIRAATFRANGMEIATRVDCPGGDGRDGGGHSLPKICHRARYDLAVWVEGGPVAFAPLVAVRTQEMQPLCSDSRTASSMVPQPSTPPGSRRRRWSGEFPMGESTWGRRCRLARRAVRWEGACGEAIRWWLRYGWTISWTSRCILRVRAGFTCD